MSERKPMLDWMQWEAGICAAKVGHLLLKADIHGAWTIETIHKVNLAPDLLSAQLAAEDAAREILREGQRKLARCENCKCYLKLACVAVSDEKSSCPDFYCDSWTPRDGGGEG